MARKKTTVTPASRLAAAVAKKFGSGKAIILSENRAISQPTEWLSTGVDVLDHYVLGRGGLPVGRASEWFGGNNIGKTTLLYRMLARTQKHGVAVYIDVEQSFDEDRAVQMGVNPKTLVIVQPYSLEELFEEVKEILRLHNVNDGPMLLGWDSIASAVTETAHGKVAGKSKVADVPQILSQELKKVTAMLPRKRAHLVMLNQIRDNIGVMFGDKTNTPGGHAPKFYSSQRVQFLGGKAVKNARSEHVAKIVTAIAVKNRLGPPFRKARIRLDYSEVGYNNVWSTVFHAKRMQLMKPREKGFAGPSKEGIATYMEATELLGWPDPEEMPKLVGVPLAAADDEEDKGSDDDNDEEE